MILRAVGGCLRRLLILALLVGGIALVWRYHGRIIDQWRELRTAWAEPSIQGPSPALADTAEQKLTSLARDAAPSRIALSEAEVQSLVRYRVASLLPLYVDSPRVRLRDGRVHVDARVPVERVPALAQATELAAFLPDTADFTASGHITPLDDARVALEVAGITAARIPLPERMIPGLLDALGRQSAPRLPRNAVALPLPPGARTVYVSGDSLVFLARRRAE